ncbi:hypothetical protein DL95DRAFT_471875 [Leptodontidium sp. 2 PMI_412]|nr:hypothetical protein DL95DRAFT_471875 [Leptodontidium sp. 2 PMI_412]
MTNSTYDSIILSKRPEDFIVPGVTFSVKTREKLSANDLKDGEVLVETLYLAIEAAMRGWLSDVSSYMPPVPVGGIMPGIILGEVIASKSDEVKVGQLVTCFTSWSEQVIVAAKEVQPVVIPPNGRTTDALGVLGSTGMTAYFGILEIGAVKAGDFVVVSAAAGAVAWLKELGCDYALNYKDENFALEFLEQTGDLIDVYFDNVGGDILDLALSRANLKARFIVCGAISQYNAASPQGIKNMAQVVIKRIKIEGFLIFDYVDRFIEAGT